MTDKQNVQLAQAPAGDGSAPPAVPEGEQPFWQSDLYQRVLFVVVCLLTIWVVFHVVFNLAGKDTSQGFKRVFRGANQW